MVVQPTVPTTVEVAPAVQAAQAVLPPPMVEVQAPTVVQAAAQVASLPAAAVLQVSSATPVAAVGPSQGPVVAARQVPQYTTAMQQLASVSVSAEQLSSALATAVPKKGKKCYRCGVAGHRSADCKVEICVICEGPAHGDRQCHLLTAPKPQIRVYGYGHEELIFFEYPCTASYKPKMENVRLASIVVTGGEMTIPGIVLQLQRLVPVDNFVWDVRRMGQNIFQVQFPTRNDLDRLKIFGVCTVPNSECKITFYSWTQNPLPVSSLPEVWLRVYGIPSPHIGDFLALWAVGEIGRAHV